MFIFSISNLEKLLASVNFLSKNFHIHTKSGVKIPGFMLAFHFFYPCSPISF